MYTINCFLYSHSAKSLLKNNAGFQQVQSGISNISKARNLNKQCQSEVCLQGA